MQIGHAGLGLVVALCACAVYDPVDEIDHHVFPDTASAIAAVLDEAGASRVFAVGEYHPSRTSVANRSPMASFTGDIVELLVPHAQHLIVETWLDRGCESTSRAVEDDLRATLGRAPSTTEELPALAREPAHRALRLHGLPMTCIEHGSLLDGMGRVDFLRLLLLVTEKLGATTRQLLAEHDGVIVYGGAIHNDLHPRWPLEELSYTVPLQRELGGAVLELDLVVPEVVATMPQVRQEAWFPLLGRAAPDTVLVWRRAPHSYVVILPARDLEARKVALPVAAS